MYGWLCGIIRSKLALSVSFVAATIASTHGDHAADHDDREPVVEDQPLEPAPGVAVEVGEVAHDRHAVQRVGSDGHGFARPASSAAARGPRAGRR